MGQRGLRHRRHRIPKFALSSQYHLFRPDFVIGWVGLHYGWDPLQHAYGTKVPHGYLQDDKYSINKEDGFRQKGLE